MKQNSALLLFFCSHALFIFFKVHQQAQSITIHYQIQKLQKKLVDLSETETQLHYILSTLQQPDSIKAIAVQQFEMHPIELKTIRKCL